MEAKLNQFEKALREQIQFTVQAPTTADTVIYARDYGFSEKSTDNTGALKRALEACRRLASSSLVLEPGIYDMTPPIGAEPYLLLDDMHHFILDGNGAELRFSQVNFFLHIQNSSHVTVRNLILDWDWAKEPLASGGVITDVSPDGAFFDCCFPTVKELPQTLDIRIVTPMNPVTVSPGVPKGAEFRPYLNPFTNVPGQVEENQRLGMEMLIREKDNVISRMERISQQTMRFYSVNPMWTKARIHPGQLYLFRHYEYDGTAVYFTKTTHLSLQNITVYSCPGSGFVGRDDVSYFEIDHCKIMKRPGTLRPISTAVDCMHLGDSQGFFRVTNCEFSGAGDDCINFHDNTAVGVLRENSRTILVSHVIEGRNYFHEGDLLQFRDLRFVPMDFRAMVVAVCYLPQSQHCRLTLDRDVPEALPFGTIVQNTRYHTDHYILADNHFHSERARGILVHGSTGIIENNFFHHIQGAAIQIETGSEARWSEGTGVKDVLFLRNRIESCDVNQWQMAVVYMGVYLPKGRTSYPVFQNIVFRENTIVNFPRLAFFLSSAKDVILYRNALYQAEQAALSGCTFGSNQEESPMYGETYAGHICTAASSNIIAEENTLLNYSTGENRLIGVTSPPQKA